MKKSLLCTWYIVLCTLYFVPCTFASDISTVRATYEYTSDNPNETPSQVQSKAFERAKLKALEEKFGLDVANMTSTFVSNSSGTNVLSLGGTSVRGEWIETLKEQVLEPAAFKDGFWRIKVHVEGRARNNTAEKTDIRYTFVRNVQDIDPPVSFRDGNDLFLRFSSPAAGSLCVYLVDEEQNAFCLLPYPHQQTGCQAVEANRDYVFFSEKYDKDAQEYTVNCERSSEQNALYVIFSPNTFSKASDRQSGTNWRDEQMPRQLSHEAFLKWLARNQTKDPQMVVRREIISIRK
ncbi:MAG: hypothetical protein IKP02_05930 [Paludibacteraceae bacterium]|nr:hypothetical protein [Paludibacteraceae bacterium]